ncbi:MAG: hypothetical protein AAF682_07305 [Planctomycetota bacterium]
MKQATWLLPLLLAPAVQAQAPTPSSAEAQVEEQREERFLKHLLHLKDGRILRVKARETEAGWEFRSGKDTTLLPTGVVERGLRERDVLAQAKKLARGVDAKEPARRVALAGWMFEQGLAKEALKELDPVLADQPDQKEALALLRREKPALVLPPLAPTAEALTTYLRTVANAKPAAKEVAIERLGELRESVDLQALLRGELTQSSVRRRELAAHALRRLFPGAEVKAMLNRAILDGSANVREEASLALRAAEEPAVILPALRALGSSSSAVRKNASEALGVMGYAHAVEPLYNHLLTVNAAAQSGGGYHPPASNIFVGRQISYVQDYDVEVAQGSAIADPVINTLMEGSVLDVRVLAVSQSQLSSERAAIRRALTNLTGASPGNTTKAWTAWWQEHGDQWTTGDSATSTKSPTSPGR